MKHWTVYVCIFLIIYTCLHVHGFARTFFANICVYSYKNVGMFKIHFLHGSCRFPPSDNVNLRLLQGQGNDRKMWEDITTDDEDTDISRFPFFFELKWWKGTTKSMRDGFHRSTLIPQNCHIHHVHPCSDYVCRVFACKEETIQAAYEETRCLKLSHPKIPGSWNHWVVVWIILPSGRRDCESGDLLVIPLNQQSVRERDFWVFSCLI